MDQVRFYLAIALEIAFLVCYLMLMWQFLLHKQWTIVLLCLFFSIVCGGVLVSGTVLSVGPGYLIAMVVGWQEAKNWDMKKLMRWYTGLFAICFIFFVQSFYLTMTAPPPVDPKAKQKTLQKAPRH